MAAISNKGFSAGKEKPSRTILLEFREVKKETSIDHTISSKQELVEKVFGFAVDSNSYLSLQRFDTGWGEYVDVDIRHIQDRDKVRVHVIKTTPTRTKTIQNPQESAAENAVDRLLQNLKEDREALDYRLNIAMATLSSMKMAPRPRNPVGRNASFTCSNCHYRGHRANVCQQEPCQGYFECGSQALHKEYRGELREAENEVKDIQKQIKKNIEEIENTKLLRERTRTNFFAAMRKRLQSNNPIKYSSRVVLDNDLRILAVACNHKVPSPSINNLEDIIDTYKNNARSQQWRPSKIGEQSNHHFSRGMHSHDQRPLVENWNNTSRFQVDYQSHESRSPTSRSPMSRSPMSRSPLSRSPMSRNPMSYTYRSVTPNFRNNTSARDDGYAYRSNYGWSAKGHSPNKNHPSRTQNVPQHGSSYTSSYRSPAATTPYNKSFYGPIMYNSTVTSIHGPVYQSPPYEYSSISSSHNQKTGGSRNATNTYSSPAPRDSYQYGNAISFSRKRLHYNHDSSSSSNKNNKAAKKPTAKELGKKFRASLNESKEMKNGPENNDSRNNSCISTSENLMAHAFLESDDETQDIESPAKHESNSPLLTTTTKRKDQEAGEIHDEEESQAFNFDNWAENQKEISKKISELHPKQANK